MRVALRGSLMASLVATAFIGGLACKDESPAEDHEPESAKLFNATSGAELTPTIQLLHGATTRVRVVFYAADGDSINLPPGHFTRLTFTPGTFATVDTVAGQRLHRDVLVNAAAAATATLSIGYGHDSLADELTFGPFNVAATVAAALRRE